MFQVSVKSLHLPIDQVVQQIVHGLDSDVGRVRALFSWMTTADIPHIPSDMRKYIKPGSALYHIMKLDEHQDNHANFFQQLCM